MLNNLERRWQLLGAVTRCDGASLVACYLDGIFRGVIKDTRVGVRPLSLPTPTDLPVCLDTPYLNWTRCLERMYPTLIETCGELERLVAGVNKEQTPWGQVAIHNQAYWAYLKKYQTKDETSAELFARQLKGQAWVIEQSGQIQLNFYQDLLFGDLFSESELTSLWHYFSECVAKIDKTEEVLMASAYQALRSYPLHGVVMSTIQATQGPYLRKWMSMSPIDQVERKKISQTFTHYDRVFLTLLLEGYPPSTLPSLLKAMR